jgi:acyl carrier protein
LKHEQLCRELIAFVQQLTDLAPTMESRLLEEQMVDSFVMLNIVTQLEDWLEIEVEVEDLDVDRFETIDSIARWGLEMVAASGAS